MSKKMTRRKFLKLAACASLASVTACSTRNIKQASVKEKRISSGTSTSVHSITMTTDKMRYAREETIKLKVANGLEVPIWYLDYTQPDLVFWELERAQKKGWERLDFFLPVTEGGKEVCVVTLYEQPIGSVVQLKPNSKILYQWNQRICPRKTISSPYDAETIAQGRYRFSFTYSLKTVRSQDTETKPWKRPIELSNTKVVYSNEFVIK